MNKVVATSAPAFRSVAVRNTAWVYTAVLTVMAIGQLYAFEKFLPLLREYELPGGDGTAALVAGLVVVAEIFAVPFLLRMRVSPLMRRVSAACSVVVPLVWLVLAVHALLAGVVPANGGMFGTKLTVAVQLQLGLSLVIMAVAVYVIRGTQHKHKK